MKAGGGERSSAPIPVWGRRLVAAGAVCVVLGFLALTRVDALALNWFSTASPLLILGGYALVGLGLAVPAPREGGENPSSVPPARP
jgi:hypothetical protein